MAGRQNGRRVVRKEERDSEGRRMSGRDGKGKGMSVR